MTTLAISAMNVTGSASTVNTAPPGSVSTFLVTIVPSFAVIPTTVTAAVMLATEAAVRLVSPPVVATARVVF
jgi:hypothetical protein